MQKSNLQTKISQIKINPWKFAAPKFPESRKCLKCSFLEFRDFLLTTSKSESRQGNVWQRYYFCPSTKGRWTRCSPFQALAFCIPNQPPEFPAFEECSRNFGPFSESGSVFSDIGPPWAADWGPRYCQIFSDSSPFLNMRILRDAAMAAILYIFAIWSRSPPSGALLDSEIWNRSKFLLYRAKFTKISFSRISYSLASEKFFLQSGPLLA